MISQGMKKEIKTELNQCVTSLLRDMNLVINGAFYKHQPKIMEVSK